jgi:hypothetical protein
MLFDENYNLASTQSLKNKDIPEGGAKGTILPSLGAAPRQCFEKYVDVGSICICPNPNFFSHTFPLGYCRYAYSGTNAWYQGASCGSVWQTRVALLWT